MATCTAYCPACDAEVRVSYDPGAGELDPARCVCLERGIGCSGRNCFLDRMSGDRIASCLEFLPPELYARRVPGRRRDLADAARCVEAGRRAAMARRHPT